MLRKALSSNRAPSRQTILSKRYTSLCSLLSYLVSLTLSVSPAVALTASFGVVRSEDNADQWTGITTRLQSAGINYCILDLSNLQQQSDLSKVSVLFLPNIANLTGAQALILDQWINQGGRIIVAGPTGTLSQPEVRSQLRSIFGAYWGFANSAPTTLKLVENQQQSWGRKQELSSTFVGGVIIPTGVNSKTAAVWVSDGSPPAVVVTEKSTFFGWRWGIDSVAPASLDTAWLQAALGRYGIRSSTPVPSPSQTKVQPESCNPQRVKTDNSAPILSNPQEQSRQLPQSPPSAPNQAQLWTPIEPANNALTPAQVTAMRQELLSLIDRFESTLLAAEATNSGINQSTRKVIEQFLTTPKGPRDSAQPQNSETPKTKALNGSAYQAILEARAGLQNFLKLVDQQNYDQARQQWLKARRTLWDHYPTDRPFAEPEIRAMWLDRGTIVQAKSEAELAVIFDRMAEAGINTVFLETVNASYPIYPSRIAPEQNPLTLGWDPLKAAINLAHERKMELHAWVWVFGAANQRHNLILNQPLNYLGPVLSQHPDWAITDRTGNPFDYTADYKKAFLDPANPEVRRYLLALLDEIATNYEVDGIHLDYIRYPFQDLRADQTFGYSNSSRWLFKQMTEVDPIDIDSGHPLWDEWTGFRIRQVDSFVAEASQQLKRSRPNLILSTAVFPMPQRERLFRLQQNWEEWGKSGWVDLIVLMTYALDTDNLAEMTQPLFDQSVAGATLLLPGLRLLKVPDPVMIDQMQFLRNMPTGGYALFAAENLTPDLQTIFGRIQGSRQVTQLEPLPYRQPFKATAVRYLALQREWSFLLTHEQLLMDKATLENWGKQVDALGATLDRLAQEPSNQNFATAQADLTSFRRQFETWMRQHKATHPYQVQVWENRLETLERLLSYGDRMVLNQGRGSVAEK